MIFDKLHNASLYHGLGSSIEKSLKFLESEDFSSMEIGKYPIEGNDIFYMVSQYETKPAEEVDYEAHRKYIDIQYIVEGQEIIGYANLGSLNVKEEYNAEKDIGFLEGEGDYFTIRKGDFVIFFPEDAHQPCLLVDKPETVKKIVVKVRLK